MTERHDETAAGPQARAAAGFLTELEATLYTAVVSDALDELGFRDQAMAEHLRPVGPVTTFAGWARTVACVDMYHVDDDPYGLEIEAVDSILPGEVVVVSTGRSRRNAPWGELLSTAAVARGARGAIVDGLVRDVRRIQEMKFPLFAAGFKPVDSKGRGRVTAYGVPVECGGVLVHPGDLIFADLDGIVAIPAAVVEDAIRLARDKAQRETHTRDELKNGAYLRTVYDKYGVL